jgi:hypothetical protein
MFCESVSMASEQTTLGVTVFFVIGAEFVSRPWEGIRFLGCHFALLCAALFQFAKYKNFHCFYTAPIISAR